MVEFDVNEAIFNRDFLQGFLNMRAIKGYTFVPAIPKMELDDDTFSYFEEDSVEEAVENEKIHRARRMPEGAMFEEISVTGFNEKHGTVHKKGFKLTVGENLLKRQPTRQRSLLNKMATQVIALCKEAENRTYNELVNTAKEKGLYNVEPENGETIPDKIGENANLHRAALLSQAAYDLDVYSQELDFLMYNKYDFAEVRSQLNDNEVVTQNRQINGWQPGESASFDYAGITFMKGPKIQQPNTELGWDKSQDFGYLFYTKEKKGYDPDVVTGLEEFAPLINVTIEPPSDYDMPSQYVIRAMMGTGLAVESPHQLWYRDNIGGN